MIRALSKGKRPMRFNPIRVGLVVGVVLGLYHAAWSALVALGLAQKLIDCILTLHFLKVPVTVEPFDLMRAAILVGVTFVVGVVIGIVFAIVWNLLHPKS